MQEWPIVRQLSIVTGLRQCYVDREPGQDACKILFQLMEGSNLVVRRASAYALAEMYPSLLLKQTEKLLISGSAGQREIGIWAAIFVSDDKGFVEQWQIARHDQERVVREAASLSYQDRLDRKRCAQYLDIVLDTDQNDLGHLWRYGQTLCDIGDDETLRHVRAGIHVAGFTVNKRAWLAWLAKKLQSNWERRQKRTSGRSSNVKCPSQ